MIQITRVNRKRAAAFCALITLMLSSTAHATVIRVPQDYRRIQRAIDVAVDGDTVLIANGTFTGPGNRNINFKGKAITVRSALGPRNCIIDCEDAYRAFEFDSGETESSLLQGIQIINGYQYSDDGAGILITNNSSPTITNCWIKHCFAEMGNGGGLAIDGGYVVLNSCVFEDNRTWWDGGGAVYVDDSSARIDDCTFVDNVSLGDGGALYVDGYTEVIDTTFEANYSPGLSAGAAVYANQGAFTNCAFDGNFADTSSAGGAVFIGVGIFDMCSFIGNESNDVDNGSGGAVHVTNPATDFYDCTFSDNLAEYGGTIYGDASFFRCTIERSNGSAIVNDGISYFEDCDFFENTDHANFDGEYNGGAVDGGGVFVNCRFKNNYVDGFHYSGEAAGAAVYGIADFVDCTFMNNEISNWGFGSAFAGSGSFDGCDFYDNIQWGTNLSGIGGGAVTIDDDTTFENCTFGCNESEMYDGGAIWILSGTVDVINTSFTYNTCAGNGGAMYVYTGATVQVSDSDFCKNSPDDIDGLWTDLGGNLFRSFCKGCLPLRAILPF